MRETDADRRQRFKAVEAAEPVIRPRIAAEFAHHAACECARYVAAAKASLMDIFACQRGAGAPGLIIDGRAQLPIVRHSFGCPTPLA